MKRLLYPIAPLLLLLSQCTNHNDVRQAYSDLAQADTLLRSDKLRARAYVRQALAIAEKANDPKVKAIGLQKLASTMRYNINLDSLLDCDKKAIAAARATKEAGTIANALGAYANDLFQINDLPAAQKFLEEQKRYCDSSNNDSCKAMYLCLLGLQHFKMNKTAQARSFFEESQKLAEKSNAPYLAAVSKLKIFQANVYSGIIDTTARLAFEAIDYFKKNNYAEGWATGQQILGDSYFYQGNMKKALELAVLAHSVFVDHQNYMGAMAVQNTLFQKGAATDNLPLVKNAAEATDTYAGLMNYPTGKGMAKVFWGRYYSANGEFEKADQAFAEADSIAERHNLASIKMMNTMVRTLHFEHQKKTKQADSMAVLSYRQFQKGNAVSKELIQNSFKNKEGKRVKDAERKLMEDSATSEKDVAAFLKSSRERNDTGKSEAFVPLLSVFDSSVSLANARQLMDVETQYKTHLVTDSLNIQKKDAALAKQQSKNKNLIIYGGILVLLLVSAGFWLQYKNRRRAERDKARIELLQNEIHHRVKNNLAVINRLVDVAGKDSVQNAPLAALKTRIKSIELLHRHLYSEEAKTGNIALQPYFDDLCTAIAATFETAKDIRINVTANAEVDSAVAEKLGLIVNELVTNSFKYAFNGKEEGSIDVKATQAASGLNLVVQDNGAGMPAESPKDSYGMKLIKGLSRELNGTFSFQTHHGTAFQLSVPA